MDNKLQLDYLKKLITPYEKKGKQNLFILQFARGAGNELAEKFWSPISSSRLAFDLYSWLAEEKSAIDFEFEKQLPGLNSGGMGPNMDVYIETNDEIIFIESKFTEKADLRYINRHNPSASYLSPAYYAPVHGKKQMKLVERFDNKPFAEKFSRFCTDWQVEMDKHKEEWYKRGTVDWFEPKQETCHLSGILLFLFNDGNKALIKDKSIRLYNIYWKLENDKESDMKKSFCKKAQQLINDIVSSNKSLGIRDFKIDAFTAQEMLKTPGRLSSHIRFPKELCETITKRNEKILDEANIKSR